MLGYIIHFPSVTNRSDFPVFIVFRIFRPKYKKNRAPSENPDVYASGDDDSTYQRLG